jgi:hypothetical protein
MLAGWTDVTPGLRTAPGECNRGWEITEPKKDESRGGKAVAGGRVWAESAARRTGRSNTHRQPVFTMPVCIRS